MNEGSSELVSVIVPFLNGSHWLVEALQSVINQTYSNWELIVIDDGSDEKHSSVAKNFCSLYANKILYTEHDGHVNKGVTISRNEAAKRAHGKYIAFLDADDVWLPQKMANQLAIFKAHPKAEVVCGPSIMWYSWNDNNAQDFEEPIGAPAGKCYKPKTLTKLLYPFQLATPPAPSGIMITKEAFKRVNGFEPAFSGIYELYEDQAFLSKLYVQEVIFISCTADFMYRKRNNSMSSAANNIERYYTVRTFYLNWLQKYLSKHKINDKEINFLIDNARKEMTLISQV